MKKFNIYIALILLLSALVSCKKYLEEPADASQVTIRTLTDLQGLLENQLFVNFADPFNGEAAADNYYLLDADYNALTQQQKNAYNWSSDDIYDQNVTEWGMAYDNIYKANTILTNISKIERTFSNQTTWDDLKGQAYFLRAKALLQLATVYVLAYDKSNAQNILGLPLRLSTDVNEKITRSSQEQTYQQIVSDFKEAAPLLLTSPVSKVRPSKQAAFGLLARTYLAMQEYDSSINYANRALTINNVIYDYNLVSPAASSPFAPEYSNPEILYAAQSYYNQTISQITIKPDSVLYKSYGIGDLRRVLIFEANGLHNFKGSYTGNLNYFTGIATNELYLTRAESFARVNKKDEALSDLNLLLAKRWTTGTFVPYTALNSEEALAIILAERRKELPFSGLRWFDIKRLNQLNANIVIKRVINGQTYLLPAKDLRFAIAIPPFVVRLSGQQQNPR